MQDTIVGWLHGDTVTQEFHHCLLRAVYHDLLGPRHILNYAPQYSGVQICASRNQMVRELLSDLRAEWLWMLDQDAAFAPDTLTRLRATADPHDYPIVGALAHMVRLAPGADRYGTPLKEVVPVAYQWVKHDDVIVGYQNMDTYGEGLVEVDATGCHCLLVHRSVFEKTAQEHPYPWFREDFYDGRFMAGEDVTFCLKAREAGFPIYVDTTLEAGHVKPFVMTAQTREALNGRIR